MTYEVLVTPEVIEGWVRTGSEIPACICTSGIPEDARFVRAASIQRHGALYLMLHFEDSLTPIVATATPVVPRFERTDA